MTELANRCAAVVQRNGARVSTSLSIRPGRHAQQIAVATTVVRARSARLRRPNSQSGK